MKITTKHVSNSPVTFVTHERFAVLFSLPSFYVNSLFKLTVAMHLLTIFVPSGTFSFALGLETVLGASLFLDI